MGRSINPFGEFNIFGLAVEGFLRVVRFALPLVGFAVPLVRFALPLVRFALPCHRLKVHSEPVLSKV